MKTIYDLELHEFLIILDKGAYFVEVQRVPGGWVYSHVDETCREIVFVPFHNEFEPTK